MPAVMMAAAGPFRLWADRPVSTNPTIPSEPRTCGESVSPQDAHRAVDGGRPRPPRWSLRGVSAPVCDGMLVQQLVDDLARRINKKGDRQAAASERRKPRAGVDRSGESPMGSSGWIAEWVRRGACAYGAGPTWVVCVQKPGLRMMQACLNPFSEDFKNLGERGCLEHARKAPRMAGPIKCPCQGGA